MKFIELLHMFKKLEIDKSIDFELMNEVFISHHSTRIEGSTLSLEEVQLLIKEGKTAKGKPLEDHLMVKDHYEGLVWMVKQARQQKDITPAIIKEISSFVMRNTGGIINATAGSFDSSKGDFRKSSVSVGTRYFTNYLKIEREICNLCEEINNKLQLNLSEEDTYKLAFDAHFYLVSIHPFADGNGRVSRLLMNYILAYKNQPLATIFNEDKLDYYAALEASRLGDVVNLEPIRNFMFSQQSRYFEQEINKFNRAMNFDNRIRL